jgi:hypothetical protein
MAAAASVRLFGIPFIRPEPGGFESPLGTACRQIMLFLHALPLGDLVNRALRRRLEQAWLADVLACIADHTIQNLDELLPWNWRPSTAKLAA